MPRPSWWRVFAADPSLHVLLMAAAVWFLFAPACRAFWLLAFALLDLAERIADA